MYSTGALTCIALPKQSQGHQCCCTGCSLWADLQMPLAHSRCFWQCCSGWRRRRAGTPVHADTRRLTDSRGASSSYPTRLLSLHGISKHCMSFPSTAHVPRLLSVCVCARVCVCVCEQTEWQTTPRAQFDIGECEMHTSPVCKTSCACASDQSCSTQSLRGLFLSHRWRCVTTKTAHTLWYTTCQVKASGSCISQSTKR